ncbi:amidohydrolase [Lacrimispora sp. NSJ-141]|uniref:Amidohydrolase n=1 Tax=Lientehia hominis TaxID=2897778 RepID=A0AAP2RHE8_9FIRM|nr:amidohydrolase family protein [Lientehia hominis]MCD2492001.1 amidohydrolase [Lientehia hominis]
MYEALKDMPLIDTHVHRVHPDREPEFGKIAGGYIDGPGQDRNSRQTILYEMVIQALRERFGMPEDTSDAEVEAERFRRYTSEPKKYMRELFSEGNVAMSCFETGSPLRGRAFTGEEAAYFYESVPKGKRSVIIRIERSVDELLDKKLSYREFTEKLTADLDDRIIKEAAVGLKSSVAYYGGLNIQLADEKKAEEAYEHIVSGAGTGKDEKCLYTFTLMLGVEAAVKHGIPLQIHTGAGGGTLDFKSFDPVGLTDFLRDSRVFNRAKIVLLHGGHPHEEDASFLTAQFSNVYTDCSGTFYLCTVNGVNRLRALMERTPMNKLMYGSDGVMFPELAWFGHGYFRKVLARVLTQLAEEGFIREKRALEFARMILYDNALECYSKLKERMDR